MRTKKPKVSKTPTLRLPPLGGMSRARGGGSKPAVLARPQQEVPGLALSSFGRRRKSKMRGL
jgi:hypothetical protein